MIFIHNFVFEIIIFVSIVIFNMFNSHIYTFILIDISNFFLFFKTNIIMLVFYSFIFLLITIVNFNFHQDNNQVNLFLIYFYSNLIVFFLLLFINYCYSIWFY